MADGIVISFEVVHPEAEFEHLGDYELPEIPEREDRVRIDDTTYEVLGRKWDLFTLDHTAYAVGILLQKDTP